MRSNVVPGYCSTNPTYMRHHCRLSCDTCLTGTDDCSDNYKECSTWAADEGCEENPEYMKVHGLATAHW